MEVIYEYGFYEKMTHKIVSSRYIDKLLCTQTDRIYDPKKYSSLYETIIWYGISLYIEAKKEGKSNITEEFLNSRHPFEGDEENPYFQKIYDFIKEIFIKKYDFIVKICDK
jgi:hypothetical protein